MNNFFTLDFWFNQRPGELIASWKNTVWLVVILFFALTIFVFIFKKRGGIYAKLREKIFNFSLTNFIIGLVLLFFNNEMIPLLSSRFWFLFWFIGMAVWLSFIIRYTLTIPVRKKDFEKQKEFQKYIPK